MNKNSVIEKAPRCPTCRKPAVPEHRPFCSKRCANIDLARWLGGQYVIAGSNLDLTDDSSLADDTIDRGSKRAEGQREDT